MLHVTSKFAKVPDGAIVIDTTSNSGGWADLSPFILPGGRLYGPYSAQNVENAWQYAKLYAVHADADGNPADAYWQWAQHGWADRRAHRYPMGKGAKPLCSLWDGKRLGYIEARKRLYAPLYARSVVRTTAFAQLRNLVEAASVDIFLRDYDGYDHVSQGTSMSDVMHDPAHKMGHAFVLWMLLRNYNVPGEFEASRWLSSAGAVVRQQA